VTLSALSRTPQRSLPSSAWYPTFASIPETISGPPLIPSASSDPLASVWCRRSPPLPVRIPCCVVSDTWPGWLQALPGFGFHCTVCFLQEMNDWTRNLLSLHPGCVVTNFAALSWDMVLPPGVSWLFLQGTSALLDFLPPTSPSGCTVVGTLDASAQPLALPWIHTVSLSHVLYGGVIDGNWSLFSNDPCLLPTGAPPKAIARRLCHVIDKTRRVSQAKPMPPLEPGELPAKVQWVEGVKSCIDWNGIVPQSGLHNLVVYCPLVFSPTGWVTRPLTVMELAAIFDVSETLLTTDIKRSATVLTLPFLSSTPSRLLCSILERVNRHTEEQPQPVRTAFSPRWKQLEGLEWLGVSDSTTRSDDAEAPTLEWNQRVL
jgi:hypothetical protein